MHHQRTREEKRAALLKYSEKRPWSYQHMLDLDDRYPEVEIFGPQCISAEVRPGWADLLENCLRVLSENGCKAGQIKQKFGGLRIYWDYPDHIEAQMSEWRAGNPKSVKNDAGEWISDPPAPCEEERRKIAAAVKPVIDEMEALSFLTCEYCGVRLEKGGPKCGMTECETCAQDKSLW